MKKVLVLMLVLAMASLASAVTTMSFQVDPASVKDNYMPSDIITINLVDTGHVIDIDIAAITDNGAGGVASAPLTLTSAFGFADVGRLTNDGETLIKWVTGSVTGTGVYATGVLYSFQYHVPDVPASTMITIGDFSGGNYWLPFIDYFDGSSYEGHVGPLTIHVIPEPMTMVLLGLGGLFLRRRIA